MLYPSIDQLLKIVDSKYTLTVAAAKRARQLRDGAKSGLRQTQSKKYVGNALEEIVHQIVRVEGANETITTR